MSQAYEFLKECGTFYVLTINGDYPAGRPFGVIMEDEGDLLIATHDGNHAHLELRNNGHMQIIAKKESGREWIRVTGVASECDSLALKQKMMDENPFVEKHYGTADNEHFLMFRIKVKNVEFH